MTLEEFHAANPIFRVLPNTCWCGAANQLAGDHLCAECPAHCELEAHRSGRESPRDVELRRQLAERRGAPAELRRSA